MSYIPASPGGSAAAIITLATALHAARTQLTSVAGELAALEARLLAAHALGAEQKTLIARADAPLKESEINALSALVRRRLAREPMAQILGEKHFWNDTFIVTRDVLTPRPDSETILSAVLARQPSTAQPLRILDLGTGSGCLLLSLLREFPKAQGLGLDCSPSALAIATKNAERLGLGDRAVFRLSHWCAELNAGEKFDVIVSNPPYIPHGDIPLLDAEVREFEPHLALDGGKDGLDEYRVLLSQLKLYLARNGIIAVEIGIDQARAVSEIATSERYTIIDIVADLSGRQRVVLLSFTEQR